MMIEKIEKGSSSKFLRNHIIPVKTVQFGDNWMLYNIRAC